MNELSDAGACPGRGRVVGEDVTGVKGEDEMSDPGACPSRGRDVRHSEFKGEGRWGKDDKSPDAAACPSRGRVVGRDVGFGTCVKGLDMVKRTELDVVKRTELDVVTRTELDVFSQG